METTASKETLDKIQKLLTFQMGAEKIGSLEEANNAAEKIQRLLTKYNLEMADIYLHEKKDKSNIQRFDLIDNKTKKNEGEWIISLYGTLCRYNYSTMVIRVINGGKTKIKYPIVLGSPINVSTIKNLAFRLEERIRTFESHNWKTIGQFRYKNRNAFRRAFFMGAVSGLSTQLMLARKAEQAENAMVTTLVINNVAELKKAVALEFDNLTKNNHRPNFKNQEAANLGYKSGRTMATGESIK